MPDRVERRKHGRIKVRWPVTILTDYGSIEGETRNMTVDGIYICCDEPLPMNEVFRMGIVPPKQRTVEVTGKVVWSELYAVDDDHSAFGMGICFVEISDADRRFLEAMLSAYSSQS